MPYEGNVYSMSEEELIKHATELEAKLCDMTASLERMRERYKRLLAERDQLRVQELRRRESDEEER